jgi:hypothetical protein
MKKSSREKDVKMKAVVDLLQGRRLEVSRPDRKLILYAGPSSFDDTFWYEHPGGRTYKQTPEEVVDTIVRHVGIDALDKAVRHARDPKRRRKGRAKKVGKTSRDPSKPFKVSKTYDVITEESAAEGEVAESGFVYEATNMTLREVLSELEDLGAIEPSSWPLHVEKLGRFGKKAKVSFYQVDASTDYRTGDETQEAIHIKAEPGAMRRLITILKTRLRRWS